MLIDLVALLLLLLAVFKGLRKGLIVAVFSFLALLVGLAAALKLSATVAQYLGERTSIAQRWMPFFAFLAVFLLAVWLVRLGAKLLERTVQAAMLGWANRLGGFLFYALLYFFVYSVLLFYATQLSLVSPAATKSSVCYAYLQPFGPTVIGWVGTVIPFFKNMFQALLQFFEAAGPEAPAASAAVIN